MKDKNGIEIRTGDIVEVTGGYFKADNGRFRVKYSPGDPGWSGKYHALERIKRNGERVARNAVSSWPIFVTVNSWEKRYLAAAHNEEHAQIEIIEQANKS